MRPVLATETWTTDRTGPAASNWMWRYMSQHGTTETYFLKGSHEQPVRSMEADGASPLPLFFDPMAHLFQEGLAVGAASQRGVSKTEKIDPVSTKTRPRPTVRGRAARIRRHQGLSRCLREGMARGKATPNRPCCLCQRPTMVTRTARRTAITVRDPKQIERPYSADAFSSWA